MKRKIERNELSPNWIVADLKEGILFIPQRVKENARTLSRPEAKMYFEYKNRYPNFTEVII